MFSRTTGRRSGLKPIHSHLGIKLLGVSGINYTDLCAHTKRKNFLTLPEESQFTEQKNEAYTGGKKCVGEWLSSS